MDINATSMALGGFAPELPKSPHERGRPVQPASSGAKPQARPAPEAPPREESPPERDAVESKVNDFNRGLASLSQTKVRFRVDPGLDELLVSVVDMDTDEIVRQIPSEEMVEIAQRMREIQGILLDRRV